MTSTYIKRYIFRLLLPLWGLMLLCGCTDDMLSDGGTESAGRELPVEFEFVLASTRTDNNLIKDRESFKDKDVIHIEGQFTIPDQADNVIRYGAMSYDAAARRWTAVAGSELTWPDNATYGEFKAYYINPNGKDVNNNTVKGGIIEKGGATPTYALADLTYDTDPLQAAGVAESYGHSVKLEFTHICTYLELRGLGATVSDRYWFTREEKYGLKNSFCLQRDENNTLTFTFKASQDSRYGTNGGLVYISAKPDNGTAKFFLEPGNYDSFTLCYPAVEKDYYKYLEYTYIPSENDPAVGPTLEANHSYLLDISRSKGITINTPPASGEDETWDDAGRYFEVDVKKFLEAVANGSDYSYYDDEGQETKILQGGNNQTKLLRNVSFNYDPYNFFYTDNQDGFEPIVKQGSVFDGGHHYIKELARPLFHRNQGIIRNLGLREINATFISDEAELGTSAKDVYDQSRNGILCGWNERGTIENIRIAQATISAKIKNDTETEEDKDASQEAHNVGCIIGSNTGKVTDLALAGSFELTVEGYDGEDYTKTVDASVMIGGIVGQNAENGKITNISSYDDTQFGPFNGITIRNNCSGEAGAFYVGGIAGSSSASISWVTLSDVIIDGSNSSCVAMYMGGIAGQLSDTGGGSAAETSSCTIIGKIMAGKVNNTDKTDVTPKSYIGGVAGVLGHSITDCRTAVSVTVNTTANDGVTYATGGAFGRILKTSTDLSVENIMAYGDKLTGPDNYIGNFVGIAPLGKTWEAAYDGHNIVVNRHGYEDVGFNMDEEI